MLRCEQQHKHHFYERVCVRLCVKERRPWVWWWSHCNYSWNEEGPCLRADRTCEEIKEKTINQTGGTRWLGAKELMWSLFKPAAEIKKPVKTNRLLQRRNAHLSKSQAGGFLCKTKMFLSINIWGKHRSEYWVSLLSTSLILPETCQP